MADRLANPEFEVTFQMIVAGLMELPEDIILLLHSTARSPEELVSRVFLSMTARRTLPIREDH